MNATTRKSSLMQIIPVMFCFFVMGFVDLVGTATNYVQKDLALDEATAAIFPSLVFFWFLIFSVPTGILMNKIGRKKTVLLSIGLTLLALIVPLLPIGNLTTPEGKDQTFYLMLVAFSLLGIGNAVMQTSLNPLVTNLISGDKLASTLTFGQFIKAIASYLAPVLAGWASLHVGMTYGLGWKALFVIYAAVSLLAIAILGATPIKEDQPDKASGIKECVRLLGTPFILLCFIGIMCHVGIDVGTNTFAPKIFISRLHWSLEEATRGIEIYFIARTAGCFLGAFILRYLSPKIFLGISVAMMLVGMGLLAFCHTPEPLYVGIALIGFGNSNVFSVVFAQALNNNPNERNEVSGLMIMGLFGGTVFPLAMGFAAGMVGVEGAVAVMTIGVLYLALYTLRMKKF